MSKNRLKIKEFINKLRNDSVIFDLEPYRNILDEISKIKLEELNDIQLKDMSLELIKQARQGVPADELVVEAYALVREASYRVLDMRPFDVQVIAGIAMHNGELVEMQTGEGKTLAAVFPAYLNALTGKGAHVLTFNDYLARRDAEWMGPVYRFLGLTVGYVCEGMSISQRQVAYSQDITYLTAKEAGFDYLKGFLCMNREELVQRPFNFAVIDEADSILIDEARIPLVIAGRTVEDVTRPNKLAQIVKKLQPQVHYETDEYKRNIYMTDKGHDCVEDALGCGNLYDESNLNLLTGINNALHAEVLLKRDVDYIVRNSKIELVDEFTGRIADKRHWPYGLQAALEAKEGILNDSKGQIMASITLQNFIRLYPKICGMTGTARTAAEEFKEFYGMNVVVIPTNRPCIRVDQPDAVFTHKEAKYKALVSEIIETNKLGRPVLIGTCSVEESDLLADKLRKAGIPCQVLNAKNDELEAHIISRAGEQGAVTVSTNMAGRGTDIKLGGEQEQDRKKVVELGGLYVIGTNRHESRRIDNQLRGRAGRQGDPGTSRFFISVEDDLLERYKIVDLIPKALFPEKQEEPLDNPVVRKEIARVQRIIEGQNFDIRRTLSKYYFIMEQQRQIIFKRRMDILFDRHTSNLFQTRLGELYSRLIPRVGEEVIKTAEKQVTLYYINKCWADYLDYTAYVRESIHLVNLAGKVPVDEFNKIAVEAFDNMLGQIDDEIVNTLSCAEITKDGIDMEKEGLKAPSATWTYLVNDSSEQFGIVPILGSSIAAAINGPLLIGLAVYKRFSRKAGERD